MADSNIGALPLAVSVADDSLLVMEQQGQAMKLTGQQLKSYAKQGVELEFQDYLDEAKEAADSAAGAVSAVTGMTVEAHASETATVTKTTKNGKVNLNFGLPRGEQGEPGPEGKTGPRGPQGAPGTGLKVLAHYDTEDALRDAVTAPSVGDAYGVGSAAPYDIYVFDGVALDWKNYGQLGSGGGIVPENVVTSEGGASIEYGEGAGDVPHVIEVTFEEEPPLTAEDIEYGDSTVQEALDGLKSSVSDGKALIASAVTDKGVPTAQDASFAQMAENIGQITTGADTQDATATPGDILAPKTAYTKSGKVEGIIPSLPAQTITPGAADKTLANGQYLAGTQTIKGDPNLTSGNIKKGVSLFGVAGALESAFAATLTVKADVGAVVTATCGDTSVEALSTTGTVVMELPREGTWKVTAVRGIAQYNTVTIEVSSQYSAELTAEVHIEYVGIADPLITAIMDAAAADIGDYALFVGGKFLFGGSGGKVDDSYDKNLVHQPLTGGSPRTFCLLAGAATESHALFGGGAAGDNYESISDEVWAFSPDLTAKQCQPLITARYSLSAAAIGDYVLFAGGYTRGDANSGVVDAYSTNLTRSAPTVLFNARRDLAAASNANYALFGGGYAAAVSAVVDAYDTRLTRSTPPSLGIARHGLAATAAGNYVIFGGGNTTDEDSIAYASVSSVVDAYDLFLTRSTPEALSLGRTALTATSLNGVALFAGGKRPVFQKSVDSYDPYLVHAEQTVLSKARGYFASTAIGDYALFGGGRIATTWTAERDLTNTVDVYRYV